MSDWRYWDERGRHASRAEINDVLDELAEHAPNWVRMLRAYIRKLERKANG
jgi:phage shock protein A